MSPLLTALVLGGAGCVRAGYRPLSADRQDAQVSSDGSTADGPITSDGALDGPTGESTINDGPLREGAPSSDIPLYDSLVASPDGPSMVPCATGKMAFVYSPTMVICEDAQMLLDQCKAGALCAPGWHQCTGVEFQTRGGAKLGTHIKAWIAACLPFAFGAFIPLKEGTCGCQVQSAASESKIAWSCTGSAPQLGVHLHHGLQTSSQCWRVGQDDPTTEAFWYPALAWSPDIHAAVCCK